MTTLSKTDLSSAHISALVEEALASLRDAKREKLRPSTKTLLRKPDLRVILVAMDPGAELNEHKAPGTLIVQGLRGEAIFELPTEDRTATIKPGDLLVLDAKTPHAVRASTQAVLLLTLGYSEVSS